jgi:hypothetical protein
MSIRSTNPTDYISNNTDSPNRIIHELRNIDRTLQGSNGALQVTASVTGSPNVTVTNGAGNPVPVTLPPGAFPLPTGASTEATLSALNDKVSANQFIYNKAVAKDSGAEVYIRTTVDTNHSSVIAVDVLDKNYNIIGNNPDDYSIADEVLITQVIEPTSTNLTNAGDTARFRDIPLIYSSAVIRMRTTSFESARLDIIANNLLGDNIGVPYERHVTQDINNGLFEITLKLNLNQSRDINLVLAENTVNPYDRIYMIASTADVSVDDNIIRAEEIQISIDDFETKYTTHEYLNKNYTDKQLLKSLLSFIGGKDDTTIISQLVQANNALANNGANTNVSGTVGISSLPLATGASTSALQTTGNTSLNSIDGKLSTIDAGIPAALGQTTRANSMPVTFASDQTNLPVTSTFDLTNTHTASAVLGENLFLQGTGTTPFARTQNGIVYYDFITEVISSTGTTAGAIIFEGSNDNFATTAIPLTVFDDQLLTGVPITTAQTIALNTKRWFFGKTIYAFVRCRISTAPVAATLAAVTTFSNTPIIPKVLTIAQSVAANLQTTATLNISGTALQNTATPAATTTVRALPTAGVVLTTNIDVTSLARTASGNSGTVADDYGNTIAAIINVTAVSGTTPTLDIVLEQSSDGGTSWQPIYHARRITTTSTLSIPKMTINGRRRWSWTIAGTTPSFTFSVIASRPQVNADTIRNFFDRTITATLNSTTGAFDIEETKCTMFFINSGAATSAGQFQLQVSNDTTAGWSNVGAVVTSVANSIVASSPTSVNSKFARVICTTAGTGQTINFVNTNSIS